MAGQELDLRRLRPPDQHPAAFQGYAALAVGESFVLVSDHEPQGLRDEFEIEHPGSHGWDHLSAEPGPWRVRVSKLAATPLPRIVADAAVIAGRAASAATGVEWKLQTRERDLDSNIIGLAPGATIDAHDGPDLDVLIYVLSGSGELATERPALPLRAGALVWLPRRSRRQFTAGPDGLRYLTVHQRRQALTLTVRPPAPAR
jgi:uncharacterized protein (DUF2249 family)/quercetin dioxygenase-like cupin family protein